MRVQADYTIVAGSLNSVMEDVNRLLGYRSGWEIAGPVIPFLFDGDV